jgi:hypothetical protein
MLNFVFPLALVAKSNCAGGARRVSLVPIEGTIQSTASQIVMMAETASLCTDTDFLHAFGNVVRVVRLSGDMYINSRKCQQCGPQAKSGPHRVVAVALCTRSKSS